MKKLFSTTILFTLLSHPILPGFISVAKQTGPTVPAASAPHPVLVSCQEGPAKTLGKDATAGVSLPAIASLWEAAPEDLRDELALDLLKLRAPRNQEEFLSGLGDISALPDRRLSSLLQGGWWELLARNSPELASGFLPRAEGVSDVVLVEITAGSWARQDPSRSLEWIQGMKASQGRQIAFNTWLVGTLASAPEKAFEALLDCPSVFFESRPESLMRTFFETGLDAGTEKALSGLLSTREREGNFFLFLTRWAMEEASLYETWAGSLHEGMLRDLALLAAPTKPVR